LGQAVLQLPLRPRTPLVRRRRASPSDLRPCPDGTVAPKHDAVDVDSISAHITQHFPQHFNNRISCDPRPLNQLSYCAMLHLLTITRIPCCPLSQYANWPMIVSECPLCRHLTIFGIIVPPGLTRTHTVSSELPRLVGRITAGEKMSVRSGGIGLVRWRAHAWE
jgi:hypothetical protein